MARDGLTIIGEVAYNGFQFPQPFDATVSARFVYDTAGRTVKYVTHSMEVAGTIVPADDLNVEGTTETNFLDIRRRLSRPGAELILNRQGFGPLIVNKGNVDPGRNPIGITIEVPGARTKDVAWGPKPQVLEWKPLGSNVACQYRWQCETSIPECEGARSERAIVEFNYRLRWSIDSNGFTVRSATGRLEIPMTWRRGTRVLSDSADNYREQIKIQLPEGFRRTTQDFDLSEDKRTLLFTITDTEIQTRNPYFPGIMKIDLQHRVASGGSNLYNKSWNNSISGTIEVAPHVSKHFAYMAFQHVLDTRLGFQHKGKYNRGKNNQTTSGLVIPRSLEITEDIYGNKVSFNQSYVIGTDLETVVEATGLFTPVPGDWNVWRASIEPVIDPRGRAGLAHHDSREMIIDLCIPQDKAESMSSRQVGELGIAEGKSPRLKEECPDDKRSWIKFENNLFVRSSEGTVTHMPMHMDKAEAQRTISTLISSLPSGVDSAQTVERLEGNQTYKTTVQARSGPKVTVVLIGSAIRAGHAIQSPVVTRIGGQDAIRKSQNIMPATQIGGTETCPLFFQGWVKVYETLSLPTGDLNKLAVELEQPKDKGTP